jgi:hypothetical protein
MRESTVSGFGDADDFRAALHGSGYKELLVIEGNRFWAQVTRIRLRHLSLLRVEEAQSRIATLSLSHGLVRIITPPTRGALFCGGLKVLAGGLLAHGAGGIIYERLDGPCEWMEVIVSGHDLAKYRFALTGTAPPIAPGIRLWRPAPAALDALVALHAAATRITRTQPGKPHNSEASHGLEQQLVGYLVECLSNSAECAAPRKADCDIQTMAASRACCQQILTASP